EIPAAAPADILPEDIPLDIIHEDAHIIVINKPRGMVVHPAAGHFCGTLVNALMHHCRDSLSGINGVMRPGIVHRIDKDTSGLLVCAKNDAAHNHLAAQFAAHTIARQYLAIVHGGINQPSGTIDAPIGRHPIDRKKMAIIPKGRRAVTHYHLISRHGKFSQIAATLETGRTHQIRVHMASINRPILGDKTYGPAKPPFETNGQILHAQKLGFIHPATAEYIEFTADSPDYYNKILTRIDK
ncbi:MAG: RluA family pseudouridine synthase, partial [Defluviitaleaceae bacterium]|nr:RluA family pseudouridine synthase [Defluviitaleaceae bacterium]